MRALSPAHRPTSSPARRTHPLPSLLLVSSHIRRCSSHVKLARNASAGGGPSQQTSTELSLANNEVFVIGLDQDDLLRSSAAISAENNIIPLPNSLSSSEPVVQGTPRLGNGNCTAASAPSSSENNGPNSSSNGFENSLHASSWQSFAVENTHPSQKQLDALNTRTTNPLPPGESSSSNSREPFLTTKVDHPSQDCTVNSTKLTDNTEPSTPFNRRSSSTNGAASTGPNSPNAQSVAATSPIAVVEAAAAGTATPSHAHHSQGKLQQLLASARSLLAACNQPRFWALTVFVIAYIHQATTGFALPAMLPMIGREMGFSDMQGALLTTGYSYLYAIALVPLGMMADKMSRPKLLATGLVLWSGLTIIASHAMDYTQLLTARVGFAAAQATQNPICFSLIQELFPRSKSTALAVYNCGIYVGRALSFCAVLAARHLNDAARAAQEAAASLASSGNSHSLSSLLDPAASMSEASWRTVLRWIAIPGFVIAAAVWFTLREPREEAQQLKQSAQEGAKLAQETSLQSAAALSQQDPGSSKLGSVDPGSRKIEGNSVLAGSGSVIAAAAAAAAAVAVPLALATNAGAVDPGSSGSDIVALLMNPAFMSTTLAAAMNDVGSYALIAWQSTFYERVYLLEPSVYAPVMAMVLPIGGIIGGVGGGYLADVLSRTGGRVWVTAGASLAAAPFFAQSFLAADYSHSFIAVLVGFALSEAWRAPSAVMARSIAPDRMGATSSALYLCIRNLVGGLGPLGVAWLMAGGLPLQHAMLLIPASYILSGLMFMLADRLYNAEMSSRVKQPVTPEPDSGFQTVGATA